MLLGGLPQPLRLSQASAGGRCCLQPTSIRIRCKELPVPGTTTFKVVESAAEAPRQTPGLVIPRGQGGAGSSSFLPVGCSFSPQHSRECVQGEAARSPGPPVPHPRMGATGPESEFGPGSSSDPQFRFSMTSSSFQPLEFLPNL